MVDFYAPMRADVASLIRQWSTGTVTLTRSTPATPDPETPWIPGEPMLEVYTLDARVDGVAADNVDDTTILATDLVVIASPKAARTDGAVVDIVPRMSDTLTIDGAPKAIKKIEGVPASGSAAMFHIFVAS